MFSTDTSLVFIALATVLNTFSVELGFPGGSAGKESSCNVGDLSSIPGLGRSPGEGYDNPLQYSCLENSMDYHGVAENRMQLSNFHFHVDSEVNQLYIYIYPLFFFLDSFFIQSQLPVELSQWESPTSGSLREESDFSFSSSIKYWVASGWPWLQSSAKGSCPRALQGWGHDGSLHVQAPECLTMLCCFPNSVHIPIKCSVSYQNVG